MISDFDQAIQKIVREVDEDNREQEIYDEECHERTRITSIYSNHY